MILILTEDPKYKRQYEMKITWSWSFVRVVKEPCQIPVETGNFFQIEPV